MCNSGGLQVGALDLTDCDMQVVKLREVVSNAPDLPIVRNYIKVAATHEVSIKINL